LHVISTFPYVLILRASKFHYQLIETMY